jgi:hypothetical protein
MTASVTNPFLQVFPKTPLKRVFNTIGDIEVLSLVASKLAGLTGDQRFNDYWRFHPRLLDEHQGLQFRRPARESDARHPGPDEQPDHAQGCGV